jgi:hypothetical protein
MTFTATFSANVASGRHNPDLAAVLPTDGNAFAPWRIAGA